MPEIPPAPVVSCLRPRPLERLEADIVSLATQLTAATARLIGLIGEFDAAEGWRDWGMRSTAHWLSWKCGTSLHTGREQVRVARALRGLPLVAAAFAEGRLSYSKVRAVTRFTTVDNEADVVELATEATAAQVERLAAGMRRARTGDDVRRRHAARHLRCHYDDDGSLVGSFRLPPEQAAVFLAALDAVGDVPAGTPEQGPEGAGRDGSVARGRVDALVAIAERALTELSAELPAHAADRYQLVLHATREQLAAGDDAVDDVAHGAELTDGTRLHPATARRVSCDCPATTMLDDADGNPLHVGRRHRRIRGRLARAVHARDRGRCRAPGCTQRATQIHHIRHWANGGPTCLANLISLCDAHHWLVHEGGFTILTRSPGVWALASPAGVTVDPTPPTPPATGPLPRDPDLVDDAVSGDWQGDRLDLPSAVAALHRPTPTPPPPSPSRPATDPATDPAGSPFDWDTLNRWLDGVRDMQQRGAARARTPDVEDDD